MPAPKRTSSQDSNTDSIRKRVCKACDRCRLKKSKCDGAHPCSRCKADNAICQFGERKRSHDKVYPKGYVEMLEQQQSQLVAGLQEMYRQSRAGQLWSASPLPETNGHPLTHDILASLNLLETKHEGSGEVEMFEDDCARLQSRMLEEGAPLMKRRDSFSSDSDHSQHGHSQPTPNATPILAQQRPVFDEKLNYNAPPVSPLSPSPVPQQRRTYPPTQPSPLQATAIPDDRSFYESGWAIPDLMNPPFFMRNKYMLQQPGLSQSFHNANQAVEMFRDQWHESPVSFDLPLPPPDSYLQQQLASGDFGPTPGGFQDFASLDPMDLDFSKYIQVST